MDQLDPKIETLEKKMDELRQSIESLKKIFLWTLIITAALFILPLIGLIFVIPQFLSNYSSLLQ